MDKKSISDILGFVATTTLKHLGVLYIYEL